jgi:hypothetical protein
MTTQTPDDLTMYEYGTEPFTDAERQAVAAYEQAVLRSGLYDCLDDVSVDSLRWHEREFSREDAISYIKDAEFAWLAEWSDALDHLDARLRTARGIRHEGSLSEAAGRYVKAAYTDWYHKLNLTRREALRYLIGTAGPSYTVDAGFLATSNGLVELDGTIAAESE